MASKKFKSPLLFTSILISLLIISQTKITLEEHSKTSLGSQCKAPLTPKVTAGPMWIQTITHEGVAAFNPSPSYPIYRNVKDYGAKGDGVTDDTAAINAAISAGGRCGQGCDSSTIVPALVFFPSGTYLVSRPIIQYYYTQLVGDALNLPTILASPSFSGIAVIDSDPYMDGGANWYTNQNNFYRQVRNFRIDLRQGPNSCTGIHWQVAQATSLTNILFEMSITPGNNHQGIFMENGSGGFFSDLVFRGGKYGMWIGNQQFTSRNVSISNAATGVYLGWNWGWTFKNLNINNCLLGIDMSNGGSSSQSVGSVVLLDSKMANTLVGIRTATSATSQPHTSGSLIIDNLELTNVPAVVASDSQVIILAGPGPLQNAVIDSWGQGQMYKVDQSSQGTFVQSRLTKPNKSKALLDSKGKFFERPRPQYENYDVSDFVSVKSQGAKGDGKTDDTATIKKTLQQYAGCKIIYFPAGTYLISSTVLVPAGTRIVGEVWSVISATGSEFSSESSPKPAFKIGNKGDTGIVEISDIIFSTKGDVPGAVLVEWNIRDPAGQQGASGMWDSHFRVGGATGTSLEVNCQKFRSISPNCYGAFALLHLTTSSSAYLENIWAWTADHHLDGNEHPQISIYNARGILIESNQGPVWMYGTASEHNVMYQYSFINAQNIFLGMIQTETPYYQSVPKAPLPFSGNSEYHDPDFSQCDPSNKTCNMAWGVYMVDSSNIYLYGAGLYNFFQNYDQKCLNTEDCQDTMVKIQGSKNNVYVYNLNTKASNVMANVDGVNLLQGDNRNNFCSTIAILWTKTPTSQNKSRTREGMYFLSG